LKTFIEFRNGPAPFPLSRGALALISWPRWSPWRAWPAGASNGRLRHLLPPFAISGDFARGYDPPYVFPQHTSRSGFDGAPGSTFVWATNVLCHWSR